MIISVINHSKLADTTVLETIRAINRQISEDSNRTGVSGRRSAWKERVTTSPIPERSQTCAAMLCFTSGTKLTSMMRSVTMTGITGACRTVLSSGNCPISLRELDRDVFT